MATNYDASQVGVEYVRSRGMQIVNILNSPPQVCMDQEVAVKLADGTSTVVTTFPSISFQLDIQNNLNTPIPLVDMVTSLPTGQFTTLAQVLLVLHAVAIQNQTLKNP